MFLTTYKLSPYDLYSYTMCPSVTIYCPYLLLIPCLSLPKHRLKKSTTPPNHPPQGTPARVWEALGTLGQTHILLYILYALWYYYILQKLCTSCVDFWFWHPDTITQFKHTGTSMWGYTDLKKSIVPPFMAAARLDSFGTPAESEKMRTKTSVFVFQSTGKCGLESHEEG